MPHPRFSGAEIKRRGDQLYEQQLRAKVETEENIGKLIAIDIETNDYAIGTDILETTQVLLAKHPDAAAWMRRIGYNAVLGVGGSISRTSQCP